MVFFKSSLNSDSGMEKKKIKSTMQCRVINPETPRSGLVTIKSLNRMRVVKFGTRAIFFKSLINKSLTDYHITNELRNW